MKILEEHKLEIQNIIEGMTSGSEMLVNEIYKRYKRFGYAPYAIHEEIQKVLQLNLRRYKYYKRDNVILSIISRVEDYV